MSIDILSLSISALTPVAIAVVGYFIQRTLAQQNRSWKVQERIADKRVEIYEKIAEDLNKIYCYVMDVGDFRNETPDTIIAAKRTVDRNMYMYQALWPPETFQNFISYMDSAFATFQGVGENAKIRTRTIQKKSALKQSAKQWPKDWDARFTGEQDSDHHMKYQQLIQSISRDLMHSPMVTS
ncbi:hypothetical protein GWO43_00390 [candidate division KSB1 bacterium]|nr:hypothetical protein [candidate division KSB1 bacterium]NIR68362.1 hypothetical protein [candidate division KSB1 bacterium]NIS22547.1 hypothetical protein [candidate division KSB1 bacterium]NIT69383.1 hypothetical protein [candidate division KSB1 bacterium]NIU23044.1 hypothetical protein [candidate division KSB1 bacterium]